MDWNTCFTDESLGKRSTQTDSRSNFQKDYDRIIFCSSFRRLQNKTQVFPLPGTTFVHNRLTHSLEVASVGRSLGEIVGARLIEDSTIDLGPKAVSFYSKDLQAVISSGCLAHDIGNPAFGHSGEEAISNFFIENEEKNINGQTLKSLFSNAEWNDLTCFEGNANALRVLTQEFQGKSTSGMGITFTTLASVLKYPCSSSVKDKSVKHRKKYGYFQSEKEIFLQVADGLNLIKDDVEDSFKRHPFVYLVEAADDICYNIIDMEDAHRIGLLRREYVAELFFNLIEGLKLNEVSIDRVRSTFAKIQDENESIAYLRAKCITALVIATSEQFICHQDAVLAGTFNSSLMGEIEKETNAIKHIEEVSYKEIYRHPSVLEIEIAGYHVMSELLDIFTSAVLKDRRSSLDRTILALLPKQFQMHIDSDSPYLRVMNVIDHISGMTDAYATEMYRKLKGIEI